MASRALAHAHALKALATGHGQGVGAGCRACREGPRRQRAARRSRTRARRPRAARTRWRRAWRHPGRTRRCSREAPARSWGQLPARARAPGASARAERSRGAEKGAPRGKRDVDAFHLPPFGWGIPSRRPMVPHGGSGPHAGSQLHQSCSKLRRREGRGDRHDAGTGAGAGTRRAPKKELLPQFRPREARLLADALTRRSALLGASGENNS